MRLIDADVLKKDLTRFYDNEVTAKQLIDEQPTIEPEQRWIPCSERMPEEEGEYLITDYSGGIKSIEVDSFMFFEDGTKDWCYSQNTIAWMPLPEPYRRGGENE